MDKERLEVDIPEFRAKDTSTGELVIGQYIPKYWLEGVGYMENVILENTGYQRDVHCIDTNTLAIHFKSMLDKKKNKVFASLNKKGLGGDVLNGGLNNVHIVLYNNGVLACMDINDGWTESVDSLNWGRVVRTFTGSYDED